MKLEFEEIKVEQSDNFRTKSFDFGDKRAIINILRKKMYSDPIKAICQEVMSNCRDAHREVGTPEKPISVKLPSTWEESIHFVDEGPGISPDRMENVFLLYGNSTKRGDNQQTGGFGLGAKTPFAYTDTFTISTITDDINGRHRREYIAFIDNSQIGAMSLLKTELITDDTPTGTSIIVPVKREDFKRFTDEVKRVGSYWNVKPTILGHGITWPVEKIRLQGPNWYLIEHNHWDSDKASLALIDGIPYRINDEVIISHYKDRMEAAAARKFFDFPFRLSFGVNEIKVTANREDIDYDKDTVAKLAKFVSEIIEEISVSVETNIVNAPSLREAIYAWEKVSSLSGQLLLREPTWKGLKLTTSFSFDYGPSAGIITHYTLDGQKVKETKKRWQRIQAEVDENVLLVENDEANLPSTSGVGFAATNTKKLRTLLLQPGIESVYLFDFSAKGSKDVTEKKFNWSALEPILLSTIVETRAVNPRRQTVGTGVARGPLISVKTLERRNHSRGSAYEWYPAPDVDNRTVGGNYVTIYEGETYLDTKMVVNPESLWKLTSLWKIPFYGVLSRQAKKLNGLWTPLVTIIRTMISDIESDADYVLWNKIGCSGGLINSMFSDTFLEEIEKNRSKLASTSTFLELMDVTKKVTRGYELREKLVSLKSIFNEVSPDNNPDDTLDNLKELFEQKYPLLSIMNLTVPNSKLTTICDEIITYIAAKD